MKEKELYIYIYEVGTGNNRVVDEVDITTH